MKLKKLLFLFFTCLSIPKSYLRAMDTLFQSPTVFFPQPRFARHNLGSFDFSASNNTASQSYDGRGQTVALLNFNGTQSLLKRFVDSTLPYNDPQTFGQASMSAKYSSIKYDFKITQNIGSHFFVSASTFLLYSKFKNLLITPVTSNCTPLTQAEIDAITGLQNYLMQLNTMLGGGENGQDNILQDSIGPSLFMGGYTTSLKHFKTLDFLDINIQAGLFVPTIILQENPPVFSPIPFTQITNFGIPIMLNCAVGLFDWLNLGASGGFMPYINSDQIMPLNTTPTNNVVLINQQGFCTVHSQPFLYFNAYIEAEQLIPRFTCLLGVSYTKQNPTTYQSQDQIKFPDNIINNSPTQLPWEICNLTVSGELDLAHEDYKLLPRIKFIYICPIWGRSVFKTAELAGQFGLECIYNF